MKKFMVTSLTVLATVFLIGAAAAGVFLYQKLSPSKDMAGSEPVVMGSAADDCGDFE